MDFLRRDLNPTFLVTDIVKISRPEPRHGRPRRLQIRRLKISAWVMLGAAFCAAGLGALASGGSGTSTPPEYAVKAAYLYNFSQFVEWPSTAATADFFRICVLGTDPFGRVLDEVVAGQKLDGVRVVARRISRPDEANGCRVLFISSSESDGLPRILAALVNSAVLTVSEIPRFTQSGGMIGFVLEDNRVRFEVNAAAARRAGLKLSSQLLKLAVNVVK